MHKKRDSWPCFNIQNEVTEMLLSRDVITSPVLEAPIDRFSWDYKLNVIVSLFVLLPY